MTSYVSPSIEPVLMSNALSAVSGASQTSLILPAEPYLSSSVARSALHSTCRLSRRLGSEPGVDSLICSLSFFVATTKNWSESSPAFLTSSQTFWFVLLMAVRPRTLSPRDHCLVEEEESCKAGFGRASWMVTLCHPFERSLCAKRRPAGPAPTTRAAAALDDDDDEDCGDCEEDCEEEDWMRRLK